MKKKGLLQIAIKQPSQKLMQAAAADKYIVREGRRPWWREERYTEKTYGTRLYYTAQREENLLIIAVYIRETLAAAAEEEVEHVEVAEVMPTPVDPDSLPGLKERFRTELNTLQILLDTDRFESMQMTIERLEHIRKKMEELRK